MISILRASFWVAVVFAFVMALLPHPPNLPGDPSDKIQHVMAFAVLAALGSSAYPKASLMRFLVSLSAFGALIEVFQSIPALHRDSDLIDWIADTCAAAMILSAVWYWRRGQQKGC